MVIQTTKESGEVAVIADSSNTSTPPLMENAPSDKVAKDEQEHHISVDFSSTTTSSHNSPCSLTKFITYSRDDLIEISKLPASKARPVHLSSGAIDDSTGLWVSDKYHKVSYNQNDNRVNGTSVNSITSTSKIGDGGDSKTRLGPSFANWGRGCIPQKQEPGSQVSSNDVSSSRGHSNSTSEVVSGGFRPPREDKKRPEPDRERNDGLREPRPPRGNALLHSDWRDKSTRVIGDHRELRSDRDPLLSDRTGGRFANLDYDDRRTRSGSRSQPFNNSNNNSRIDDRRGDRDIRNSYHFNHASGGRHGSFIRDSGGFDEPTPEWMDEPTSKFEMMDLAGFEDDTRGREDEKERPPDIKSSLGRQTPEATIPPRYDDSADVDERSVTPEFERLMRDMLKDLTEEDPPEATKEWFPGVSNLGGSDNNPPRRPLFDRTDPATEPAAPQQPRNQQEFIQMLRKVGINAAPSGTRNFQQQQILPQGQVLVQPASTFPQDSRSPHMLASSALPPEHLPIGPLRTLDEIEGMRSYQQEQRQAQQQESSDDRRAFNKLLEMLNRRGSTQQQPVNTQQQPQQGTIQQIVAQPRVMAGATSMPVPPVSSGSSEWMAVRIEEEERRRRMQLLLAQQQQQEQAANLRKQAEEQEKLMFLRQQTAMGQSRTQHQESQQQKRAVNVSPAFNMVPIQVIRNASVSDRRELLPTKEEGSSGLPRAIVGPGARSQPVQQSASQQQQRPPIGVHGFPNPPADPTLEIQRQLMLQQEIRRRAMGGNMSPIPGGHAMQGMRPIGEAPFPGISPQPRPLLGHQPTSVASSHPLGVIGRSVTGGATSSVSSSLTPQQMFQLQQLQLINQQQHQMNPGVNGPAGRAPANGASGGGGPASSGILRSSGQ